FALPEQCDAVTVACLHVAVEAVVRDVQFAIVEPFGKGRRRPVKHLCERLAPVQQASGLLAPEALSIGGGSLVELGPCDGGRGEFGRGREPPGLVEEVVDLAAHGMRSFAAGEVSLTARP